jgi:hypothetical protein
MTPVHPPSTGRWRRAWARIRRPRISQTRVGPTRRRIQGPTPPAASVRGNAPRGPRSLAGTAGCSRAAPIAGGRRARTSRARAHPHNRAGTAARRRALATAPPDPGRRGLPAEARAYAPPTRRSRAGAAGCSRAAGVASGRRAAIRRAREHPRSRAATAERRPERATTRPARGQRGPPARARVSARPTRREHAVTGEPRRAAGIASGSWPVSVRAAKARRRKRAETAGPRRGRATARRGRGPAGRRAATRVPALPGRHGAAQAGACRRAATRVSGAGAREVDREAAREAVPAAVRAEAARGAARRGAAPREAAPAPTPGAGARASTSPARTTAAVA